MKTKTGEERKRVNCHWSQQDEPGCDTWGSDCGHYFTLNDGNPFDNGMRFCCYCGGRLRVSELVWKKDDEGCDSGMVLKEVKRGKA